MAENRKKTTVFNFDPATLPWQRQSTQRHVLLETKLPPPFTHVFLKWWSGRPSTAHQLLAAISGEKLSGTPRVFGWGQLGNDVIYAFEGLPPAYTTLHKLFKSAGSKIITRTLMMQIIKQSADTFKALESYQHIYTDFCTKNMMYDPTQKRIALIDLDSALSYTYLSQSKGKPVEINDIVHDTWSIWLDFLVLRGKLPSPMLLPKTMVLSIAAVWGRAIRLLENPQHPESSALLHDPCSIDTLEQMPLWHALENGRKDGFQEYFLFDTPVDGIFAQWRRIFHELTSGSNVDWKSVTAVVDALDTAKIRPVIPGSKTTSPAPKKIIQIHSAGTQNLPDAWPPTTSAHQANLTDNASTTGGQPSPLHPAPKPQPLSDFYGSAPGNGGKNSVNVGLTQFDNQQGGQQTAQTSHHTGASGGGSTNASTTPGHSTSVSVPGGSATHTDEIEEPLRSGGVQGIRPKGRLPIGVKRALRDILDPFRLFTSEPQ